MLDQTAVEYIQTNLQRGVPLEDIKLSLLSAGWKFQDIKTAVEMALGKAGPANQMQKSAVLDHKQPVKKPSSKLWITIIIIIIVAGGGFAFYKLSPLTISFNKSYSLGKNGIVEAESECSFSSQCGEGFHCFKNKCLNNSILLNAEQCEEQVCNGSSCVYNVCLQECVNCQSGKLRCLLSSEEVKNEKCVECFTDSQCKEGFVCEAYKCVASSS